MGYKFSGIIRIFLYRKYIEITDTITRYGITELFFCVSTLPNYSFACQVYRIILLRVKFTELFFCVSTPYKFSGILERYFRVSTEYIYRIILLRVNPIQVFGYIRGVFLVGLMVEIIRFCVSTPYKFSGILGGIFSGISRP